MEYVIKDTTLAILPYEMDKAIVYEVDNKKVINNYPTKIMKKNIKRYGSTMDAKTYTTSRLTGISYKVPIEIDNNHNFIFFPTSSPRLKDCGWINLKAINSLKYDKSLDRCIIKFINNICLDFNISYNVLNNQINNSYKLSYFLNQTR